MEDLKIDDFTSLVIENLKKGYNCVVLEGGIYLMHMTSQSRKYPSFGGKRVSLQVTPTKADSRFFNQSTVRCAKSTLCMQCASMFQNDVS